MLFPRSQAVMLMPAEVGDYTDFYASVFHATNVGKMLRPDQPLLPNYKWVPIGYHGRASSLVVSGTPIARPQGQSEPGDERRAALRPEPRARLRARGGRLPRPRQRARPAGPARRGRGPAVRPVPAQRLVGARPAEVGVPAARPVPRQELRDLDQPLGRDARGARSLPRGRPSHGRRATRVRCRTCRTRTTSAQGGIDLRLEVLLSTQAMRERGLRARLALPQQPARRLLDLRADGGAPQLERLQPAAGGPDRERHGLGPREGESRQPDRADLARRASRSRCRAARSGASWRRATR